MSHSTTWLGAAALADLLPPGDMGSLKQMRPQVMTVTAPVIEGMFV